MLKGENMKKLISIVAPMYNEEALVETYCQTTLESLAPLKDKYDIELLLVNDGSHDSTWKLMESIQNKYPEQIALVNLSRNFGLEGAVHAGLNKATGDAVIVMDADLQDPPALILDMVKKWEQGADVVVCKRSKRKNDTFFKRTTASLFYGVMDSLSGKIKLERNAANYRLLSRNAVNELLKLSETNGVFRVQVPFLGMQIATLSYERDGRFAGKTKYNFSSMVRYALDSLTDISIEPLRKLYLCLLATTITFFAGIIGLILGSEFWKGIFLLILVGSIFFTLLFICLIVIAEYIGQIMQEVKNRPSYIIYSYLPSLNTRKDESHAI